MKKYSRSLPPPTQAPVVVINVKPPTTVKNNVDTSTVSQPWIPRTQILEEDQTGRSKPRIVNPPISEKRCEDEKEEGSKKLSYSLFTLFSVHLRLVPAQAHLHRHTYTGTPTQAHLHCTGIPTQTHLRLHLQD